MRSISTSHELRTPPVRLMGELPIHLPFMRRSLFTGIYKSTRDEAPWRWSEAMNGNHGAQVVLLREWLSGRGERRSALFPNQFWPDAMPILGAEVPSANLPLGGSLDGNAVLGAGQPALVPVLPLTDLGDVLDVDGRRQVSDAHGALGVEVSEKVHAPIVVANAIRMQAAFAMQAIATLGGMGTADIQTHRRDRLKSLLEERFNNSQAELGAALGLKNGAFIRQLLTAGRPITEKTVAKIEALQGLAGWFGTPVLTASGETLILTDEERDVIMGMRSAKASRTNGAAVIPLKTEPRQKPSRRISNPGPSGRVKPAEKKHKGA